MNYLRRLKCCLTSDMSYILKVSAVCIVCALLALVLKKQNPEYVILLELVFVIVCLYAVIEIYYVIRSGLSMLERLPSEYKAYFEPLFKCCGVSIITQIGTSICKDAGQSAAASSLEIVGSIVSILCMLPLLDLFFQIMEGLV